LYTTCLIEADEFIEQTGARTTMSRLGMPDLGIATLNDMKEKAGMIASLDKKVPIIADADTGYGGERSKQSTITAFCAYWFLQDH
jgi:2-methylisocitrate lyase-like PEP mutase family enzyme